MAGYNLVHVAPGKIGRFAVMVRGWSGRVAAMTVVAAAMMLPASPASLVSNARADDTSWSAAGSFNNMPSGVSPQQIGIVPKPDAQVPLDTTFRDEFAQPVQLKSFVTGHRPIILVPVYYSCPKLCNTTLNNLFATLRDPKMDLRVGSDYEVVALSIDDRDTPAVAGAKKANYIKLLGPGAADAADAHIHFLTGNEGQIRQVTGAIGFGYMWNETDQLYAHQAGIFVLTPEGKVSRTIGGTLFETQELRDSLLNAGQGKIGSPLFQVALSCGMISFDGENGKYRRNAVRVMQVGAMGSMLFVGGVLAIMWRREARRSHALPAAVSTPASNDSTPGKDA